MAAKPIREIDLYPPIKRLLEGQGYEVKGEVGAADVVACREGEEPVIVELKTGFSLSLFHQGIERQALTDAVYIAVPRGSSTAFRRALKSNLGLCRRLGLGLLTVRIEDGFVEIHVDPAPFRPRIGKRKKARLLREFAKRVGDPTKGGSTRQGLMTAYRQDALRCVSVLHRNGPTKASDVAAASAVSTARQIMYHDHYGWFERIGTGIYTLTPKGLEAVTAYADTLAELAPPE